MKKSPVYAALDVYEKVAKRYPNREVRPEKYAEAGCIYYTNKKGRARRVELDTGYIYGFDWERFPLLTRLR